MYTYPANPLRELREVWERTYVVGDSSWAVGIHARWGRLRGRHSTTLAWCSHILQAMLVFSNILCVAITCSWCARDCRQITRGINRALRRLHATRDINQALHRLHYYYLARQPSKGTS